MPHTVPSWLTGIARPWLGEEASLFGHGPLVVADVTEAERLASCRSELVSTILVGVDETGELAETAPEAAPETADVFDVLLTTAPSPPRPWVRVHSIGASLAALGEAIQANPNAATMLVQVLRAQRGQTFETALLVESFAYSALLGGTEFRRWRAAAPQYNEAPENGPVILGEREGATARIVLARPSSGNALTAALRDELVEALRVACLDDTIEIVEIGSQGRVFCSGGALGEFGAATDLALAHQLRTVRSVAQALHRLKAHSRVIVQGAAVGGGIEFAAAAKEVIAHPSAFFVLPEISMGLIPGAGGSVTVSRRIGRQRTAYLALSGIRLRARTALAWGLIDRLHGE